jgi:hypothetical protein
VALTGTSWFLGLLFVLSAAAAVRIFAPERRTVWSGVVLPGAAALLLAGVLTIALKEDDLKTRVFIAASAIIGLPLALWRGRVVRGGVEPGGRSTTGSRF